MPKDAKPPGEVETLVGKRLQRTAAGKKAEPKKTPFMGKKFSQFMTGVDGDKRSKRKDYTFPTDLAGFKLAFNKDGQLRHVETGRPFEFHVRGDHSYNQKRYEALGEVITNYVYELLEKETKLNKTYLPLDATEDEPRSFVFASKDAMTNPDKLMLLIHGSGVVRAGQWARRLIINDGLDYGTQLPFIKRAIEQGYGVMVFNPNLNHVIGEDGRREHIRANWSPEDHSEYVWDKLVKKAAAKHIAIVAHSYGGVVTTYLAMSQLQEFQRRVFAIAFTDSVHSLPLQNPPQSTCQFFHRLGTGCRVVYH